MWLTVAVVVTGAVTACAARANPGADAPSAMPRLTWLGAVSSPAGTAYPSLISTDRFGSISGLAHDAATRQWIAVIDDREDSRIAWLTVDFSGTDLVVSPARMQRLRAGPGVPDRVATQADLESVTVMPDGTFVMTEEGHLRDGEVWQPMLLLVNNQGVVTGTIPFPAAFQIHDDTSGLRPNQGFESVTRTPDGRLIAGLEQPLIQDGEVTFDHGAPARLLEFVPTGHTFRPGREWIYMLSPTPRVAGFGETCIDGENGLVDLVALSDTQLVALERSCLLDQSGPRTLDRRAMNTATIYLVDLTENPAKKTVLLDLGSLTARLPPELARLENFEAIAFGPVVNNVRTLIVASDDNFRKTQKTAFLLFQISEFRSQK